MRTLSVVALEDLPIFNRCKAQSSFSNYIAYTVFVAVSLLIAGVGIGYIFIMPGNTARNAARNHFRTIELNEKLADVDMRRNGFNSRQGSNAFLNTAYDSIISRTSSGNLVVIYFKKAQASFMLPGVIVVVRDENGHLSIYPN